MSSLLRFLFLFLLVLRFLLEWNGAFLRQCLLPRIFLILIILLLEQSVAFKVPHIVALVFPQLPGITLMFCEPETTVGWLGLVLTVQRAPPGGRSHFAEDEVVSADCLVFLMAGIEVNLTPQRDVYLVLDFACQRETEHLEQQVLLLQIYDCLRVVGAPGSVVPMRIPHFQVNVV